MWAMGSSWARCQKKEKVCLWEVGQARNAVAEVAKTSGWALCGTLKCSCEGHEDQGGGSDRRIAPTQTSRGSGVGCNQVCCVCAPGGMSVSDTRQEREVGIPWCSLQRWIQTETIPLSLGEARQDCSREPTQGDVWLRLGLAQPEKIRRHEWKSSPPVASL